MKLRQLYFIFLFTIPLFWSCKPKCPVYSCNIRMHHRHGLIMKPKTLEEWGKEVNQKMNGGDSTQVSEDGTIEENTDLSSPSDSTSTVEEPKLTKEEKKAKKKQEKEEKKRKKREAKEAKKKEKEEAKAAKEQEKEEKRLAEGKPPKKKKPKKEKKKKKGKDDDEVVNTEEEDPNFSVEETAEDKEQKEKEEAAKVVYRSRVMRWWKTKDKKPKVGHRWKKPKNKKKKKLSKAHNKKAK